ncbi:MAG: hypothetical protein JWR61_1577 [Ferruginibacter sp.]|uniref:hypothetical protein n=1 Tax=Ferruginibacter sp. TaxID=1940288 RepID=UPI002659678B|nr:hypothetical protein [Ferruginibacter sp.]MDB5276622.1 hypothetical protein [Ferruginibacter sp.]
MKTVVPTGIPLTAYLHTAGMGTNSWSILPAGLITIIDPAFMYIDSGGSILMI